jgi:hypothetical protein
VKVERSVQAVAVVFIILALGMIYLGSQVNSLQGRVEKLEWMVIKVSVTIDNGSGSRTEVVYLTRGATALEALNRVAAVGTKLYSFGVFVTSIDGIANVPENHMYWMFYTWNAKENKWGAIPVGVGKYELSDGENFKASYERVVW